MEALTSNMAANLRVTRGAADSTRCPLMPTGRAALGLLSLLGLGMNVFVSGISFGLASYTCNNEKRFDTAEPIW